MAKGGAGYNKAKARYRVFPSAYASGAIAKCGNALAAAHLGKLGEEIAG
jgi:hypothetical protein